MVNARSSFSLKLHSGGKILVPVKGKNNEATELPKGDLIYCLYGTVQFYDKLHVRDIFKLLINYPEIISLFPSFEQSLEDYKKLPSIGCCNQKVGAIGIRRQQIINCSAGLDEQYIDSMMGLAVLPKESLSLVEDIFEYNNPKDWIDAPLYPLSTEVKYINNKGDINSISVTGSYTVFDVLLALNNAIENEIMFDSEDKRLMALFSYNDKEDD